MQFEPAPRRGEPDVTRRTPDYFLWCNIGLVAVTSNCCPLNCLLVKIRAKLLIDPCILDIWLPWMCYPYLIYSCIISSEAEEQAMLFWACVPLQHEMYDFYCLPNFPFFYFALLFRGWVSIDEWCFNISFNGCFITFSLCHVRIFPNR